MVKLYIPNPSERISYATYLVMQASGLKDWSIETNLGAYLNHNGPKINYSETPILSGEIWVCPHGLLSQKRIQTQHIAITHQNELPIFFQTKGSFHFDIFSASFYLVSRYEEYLPHPKDLYGRFPHTSSLAFNNNFLHRPLVHDWAKALKTIIENKFHITLPTQNHFKYIPSYDVDIAFSSPLRLCLHRIKHFLVTKNSSLPQSQSTNLSPDPLDIFHKLKLLHKRAGLQPVYFFLLAQKRGKYDKNTHPQNPNMKKLIKETALTEHIGIHPSYESSTNTKLIGEEKEYLEQLSSINIKKSRQHYIRLSFPDTYRLLIANGIEEDYSMGYGSINGFRASYTLPFKWYDLQRDELTSLTIHPFCYMDANAIFEQKLTPKQACDEMKTYYESVKQHNGQLITIAHNHFLANTPQWHPWWELYQLALTSYFKQ